MEDYFKKKNWEIMTKQTHDLTLKATENTLVTHSQEVQCYVTTYIN